MQISSEKEKSFNRAYLILLSFQRVLSALLRSAENNIPGFAGSFV